MKASSATKKQPRDSSVGDDETALEEERVRKTSKKDGQKSDLKDNELKELPLSFSKEVWQYVVYDVTVMLREGWSDGLTKESLIADAVKNGYGNCDCLWAAENVTKLLESKGKASWADYIRRQQQDKDTKDGEDCESIDSSDVSVDPDVGTKWKLSIHFEDNMGVKDAKNLAISEMDAWSEHLEESEVDECDFTEVFKPKLRSLMRGAQSARMAKWNMIICPVTEEENGGCGAFTLQFITARGNKVQLSLRRLYYFP